MKRRDFFASLALTAAAVRRAFADASIAAPARAATAAVTSKPTLVFVVPRDAAERRARGDAFGDYLAHASDEELTALAGVDIVCAPASDWGLVGEPLVLFLDGGQVRLRGIVSPPETPPTRAIVARLIRKLLPAPGKSVAALAAAARRRYVIKAPRGARWGRTTVCGDEYEEGPSEQVDCGMGHVPDVGRRFLDFYVKVP